MAPNGSKNVSKNARTARGSGEKYVIQYNGQEIEVCCTQYMGNTIGSRDYKAVEDKNAKTLLFDKNGAPLPWATAKIVKKKA